MLTELARNVRKYRRAAGMSQEDLAAACGLSVRTVQKIESGGAARTETLHAFARGLGIPTSVLFVSGTPAPVTGDESTRRSLVPIRMTLMPPVGLDGLVTRAEAADVSVSDIRRKAGEALSLYRADKYDAVALLLPDLLAQSEAVMRNAGHDEELKRAAVARSLALLVSGKYLTQMRQYDLAYHSLAEGIRLAREADDRQTAGTGIVGMCWLLLRQDRFGECYRLAVDTAARLEPRITDHDTGRIALWGELWMRAAAASIRDNRPEDAKDARRMAGRAAGGMRQEDSSFPEHWGHFGPVTVAMKEIEDLNIRGDARSVLHRADDGVLSPKSLKKLGKPPTDWERHRLDVAGAHAALGSHQDAMDVLTQVRAARKEWIKHQPMARRIMGDVLRSRKRTLTRDMREMASYLNVSE
ncbi:helix-turn-helix domain-containing protein [Streptomyces uncialis]|uniref:helix-turn-helix domain-containing protein n=1 Tax=Streptomyces uncialis TaxID=1048205 RepID=UPI00340D356A